MGGALNVLFFGGLLVSHTPHPHPSHGCRVLRRDAFEEADGHCAGYILVARAGNHVATIMPDTERRAFDGRCSGGGGGTLFPVRAANQSHRLEFACLFYISGSGHRQHQHHRHRLDASLVFYVDTQTHHRSVRK